MTEENLYRGFSSREMVLRGVMALLMTFEVRGEYYRYVLVTYAPVWGVLEKIISVDEDRSI